MTVLSLASCRCSFTSADSWHWGLDTHLRVDVHTQANLTPFVNWPSPFDISGMEWTIARLIFMSLLTSWPTLLPKQPERLGGLSRSIYCIFIIHSNQATTEKLCHICIHTSFRMSAPQEMWSLPKRSRQLKIDLRCTAASRSKDQLTRIIVPDTHMIKNPPKVRVSWCGWADFCFLAIDLSVMQRQPKDAFVETFRILSLCWHSVNLITWKRCTNQLVMSHPAWTKTYQTIVLLVCQHTVNWKQTTKSTISQWPNWTIVQWHKLVL